MRFQERLSVETEIISNGNSLGEILLEVRSANFIQRARERVYIDLTIYIDNELFRIIANKQ